MPIGDQLRQTRRLRHLSLQQVAANAGISAATLSRIETGKQSLDVALFIELARILEVPPASFFGPESDDGVADLRQAVLALPPRMRAELWTALARHAAERGDPAPDRIPELLAQVDLLRAELLSMSSHSGRPARGRGLRPGSSGSRVREDSVDEPESPSIRRTP
ncbi:MAG TPA: helix-turn-helix transcriptional regulator [Thermoanaerobaculia bacterium]|nr:helix-turn-helix transcriptional regulator [Thermoanaerobaculia bacterium]